MVDGHDEFRLWDAATGAMQRTLLKISDNGQMWRNDPVPQVYSRHYRTTFSPDGRRVALSLGWLWQAVDPTQPTVQLEDMQDRDIHVWDADKGDELCHIPVARGGSRFDGVALGPQGKQLAFVVPRCRASRQVASASGT